MTFLFTDVEGSTGLWEREPDRMQVALAVHDDIMRSMIESFGGVVFSTAGDAFAAAFSTPAQALAAAAALQVELSVQQWPTSVPIRLRMGVHTGTAQERDDNYFGPVLNRAARLMAASHGGQVVVSNATAQLLDRGGLVDLGEHLLKDLVAAERVWQLGSGAHPAIRSLQRRLHNLPVQRAELIGRTTEIVEIAGLVRQHRLVSMLGIGGTGKTRLALAVAAEVVEDFSDGVWFVDLVPVSVGEQLPEVIANAAGLRLTSGSTLEQFAAVVAGRDTLFVLDNCEHLTEAVADLIDALLETSTARFLVTSREPLDLPDEWPLRVPTLTVEESFTSAAVALFNQAAARVGTVLTNDDLPLAVAVCRHLDGLPLALELAGAQLRSLTLAELASRLDRRFELLETGRRGRRQRQASLLAVLEDTWMSLNGAEQELLRQLAAFAGPFDLDAVEAAASDLTPGGLLRVFRGLVDRSLVTSDNDGHHRLLETVKLFAQQHWADPDALGDYMERHTQWALRHVRSYSVEARHTSFELGSWVARNYDELRAVENRLSEHDRTTELVELLSAHNFSIGYGPSARAVALIERIDRYLQFEQFSDTERGRLHLLAALAAIAARRTDRMASDAAAARALLQDADAAVDLAMAYTAEALPMSVRTKPEALTQLQQAAELAESNGALAVANLALAYRTGKIVNRNADGRSTDELVALGQRLHNRSYDAAQCVYLQTTIVERFIEHPSEANEACRLMTETHEKLGVPFTEAWQIYRAAVAANLGDARLAATAIRSLQAEFHRNGVDGHDELLLFFAVLAWRLGDLPRARRYHNAHRQAAGKASALGMVTISRRLGAVLGTETPDPRHVSAPAHLADEPYTWLDTLTAPKDEQST